MGVVKTLDDWSEDLASGAGSLIQNTITGATNLVCNLVQTYPNSFFGSGLARGISNQICRQVGQPDIEPTPNFWSGGQCVDVLYTATIVADRTFVGNTVEVTYTMKLYGNIESIMPVFDHPSSPDVLAYIGVGQPGALVPSGINTETVGGAGFSVVTKSIAVTRDDMQPDNCGSLPGSLPPDPPRNSNDFKTTHEICEYDDMGVPFNCRDVDIVLPEEDIYDFPVCVFVDGKRLCLDLDGWSVEDVEEEEEKEEIECPEDADPPSEECMAPEAELTAVLVTITEYKPEAKLIVRPETEDVEYFAGYFNWSVKRGGTLYHMPNFPIRKERNYYKKPEDATDYRVVTNYDAKISVTEVKTMPKEV